MAGGALATFLLDLAIRDETQGLRGLDQLLYHLQRSTPPGGYASSPEAWAAAAAALAVDPGVLAGLGQAGTLSIESGLERAGLRMVERSERRRMLGARLEADPNGAFVVASVDAGGTAASAALREGDRVLEINGTTIAPGEVVATRFALDTYITGARTGAPITFKIERDGVELDARGQVRESRVQQLEIRESSSAPARALAVRASLFQPTQPTPSP